jgi:membrane-associated phospholipid phosphatase
MLVDSLVVTYWYRRSHRVAGQMALITAEALAVSAALHGLTAGFASRERPYGRNCGTTIDPNLDDCEQDRRFRAFFSGHATLSFAAAGVACSHHARHEVFGDPLADGVACGTAFVTAGMVAAMRVVGDQHYATDVAMGATIGTLSGLGVPWLLHYGPLAEVEDDSDQAKIQWSIVPMPNGAGVGGTF